MGIAPVLFDDLLDTRGAAAALGVSKQTIARWVQAGVIRPGKKLAGTRGGYVFTTDEVDRVHRARRKGSRRRKAAA